MVLHEVCRISRNRAMTLKFISFVGSPRDRGRQHGETMRDEIAANKEVFLTYFCSRGSNQEKVQEEAKSWLAFLETESPDCVEEIRGISEAAHLPVESVTMLNVRHEIGFRLMARQAIELSGLTIDGCTSVGLLPEATAGNSTILAQTIDGLAAVRGTMFVGQSGKSNKPSSLGVFEAGCVGPTAGLNSAGIGLVCNSLLTTMDVCGRMTSPFKLRCRSILEARTFDAAIRAVVHKDRSSSMNYMIGHADGEVISIETSPNAKRCLYPENGMVTHANHFEPGGSIVSEWERFVPDTLFRSRRFDRHLRQQLGAIDVDHIMAGLKDHFSYPSSICLHPDERPSGRQGSTISAVVIDLKQRRLLATDGPPCGAPLQKFELAA
jgi:isopenicillin-N N-acyltransferase like protein